LIALHNLLLVISCVCCAILEPLLFASYFSLENLQVLIGEDRKSMSGYCFSVLPTLILHKFDLALHAKSMMLFPYSIYIYKIGGEIARNFFLFLACQILLYFYLISRFIAH
jgi:hypothetical protein